MCYILSEWSFEVIFSLGISRLYTDIGDVNRDTIITNCGPIYRQISKLFSPYSVTFLPLFE